MRGLRSICTVLLLGMLTAGLAFSQAVSATIVGTVTDASGAVVANAKVTVTETNTGVARSALANESGNYNFPNLPPGLYQVSVELAGFQKGVRSGVNLAVDSTARVDV